MVIYAFFKFNYFKIICILLKNNSEASFVLTLFCATFDSINPVDVFNINLKKIVLMVNQLTIRYNESIYLQIN